MWGAPEKNIHPHSSAEIKKDFMEEPKLKLRSVGKKKLGTHGQGDEHSRCNGCHVQKCGVGRAHSTSDTKGME